MKQKFYNLLRRSGVPAMILGAVLALAAPATVLAQRGGGGHGFSGGGGHAFSGGGHAFSGGRSFGGGGHYSAPAPAYRGGGGYYRGGGGYYRGGYGYGWGGPYLGLGFGFGYAPGACGFYNAYGQWIPTACYAAPYGPGY